MEKGKKDIRGKRNPALKKILIIVLIVALAVSAYIVYTKFWGGEESVGFRQVKESEMPVDITADVIPEYKTLERALACMVDDDVYVIVTRGEKPTSGFGVSIDRMILEEQDGKTNLIVYTTFDDPEKETAISQIITYPLQVAKTELERLPDTIELRIQY